MSGSLTFTAGDLVISISGDGDGSGTYTDNQASPLVLEQLTTSGVAAGMMTLPQVTTTTNGKTEYAFAAEYGSSSEGTLELSADGHSLVIAGYAINAQTFDTNTANGNTTTYGTAALAQTLSLTSTTAVTPVARLIADISADGTVDTSTALFNVFNGNNPRSVATVDGSSFYISGQGTSGDTTQGVFLAQDGASSATAIDTSTDTRTAELNNGVLYVSRDSKQPKRTGSVPSGTANIASYGVGPTGATTPAVLPGISNSITLTAAEENNVNTANFGKTTYLSPENFFFANANTLYIADGGIPKEGGLGDGGLQKWIFSGGTWSLAYTLSTGLTLVANTATSGTTGLIGLTGSVSNGVVSLYATNATVGDLDQTYVFGITDALAATTAATGEAFTTLFTAAPDTNVRGIAFAPTAVACYCRGTLILTDRGEVPVEALAIGDVVVTASGAAEPILWIGRRSYAGRFLAGRRELLPVTIRAGALGAGLPRRDLLVSPAHAMLLDGLLVPAICLLNGTTVVQAPCPQQVDYFHVELAQHDAIWAEGAASETFLDDDSRAMFHNAADYAALYPGLARAPGFCAPRVESGFALEAIRAALPRAAQAA